MEEENKALKKEFKEERQGWATTEAEMVGLQKYILTKNTNNFNKVIRQAHFLYQEIS